jgi:anti-sigma28 factor (negative regulator of flagellin synthesis)
LCKDQKLANEVQRALERYIGRVDRIAQINGLKKAENEEIDLEAVKQATQTAEMSRQQRRKRLRELKKAMKDGTNE